MPPYNSVIAALSAFYITVLALAFWNLGLHVYATMAGYDAIFDGDAPFILLFGSYLRPFDLEGMAIRDAVIATTGFVIAVTALFVVVMVMLAQLAHRRRRLMVLGQLNIVRPGSPLIVPLGDEAEPDRVYQLEIDLEVPRPGHTQMVRDLLPDLRPALEGELSALAQGRLVQLTKGEVEVFLTATAQEISDGMINRVRVRRANFVIAPELAASRAKAQENAAESDTVAAGALAGSTPAMPIPGALSCVAAAESPSSAAA
ncbi:hypothetical protein [Oceanibaculum indicum]|uniref:Uncharacterized protein n=1 Tax=Oceanibaculum indicum P24 TaxID=1207063 RepID=K2IJA1_9PROT|nr:hypothetical protein [Oceanibaculum indicum]EKE70171.1 hypothetical protein P24_15821 [Oceanibaculum indicum P24]